MTAYDPSRDPDARGWLELDEQERIDLVRRYHRRAGIRLPNATLHAVVHMIIENQLAETDPRVVDTLGRLVREGLDRHEALHAMGALVAEHLWKVMREPSGASRGTEEYHQALATLTADQWREAR
jgi:hypothetical protein